jgi:hypothetical protein
MWGCSYVVAVTQVCRHVAAAMSVYSYVGAPCFLNSRMVVGLARLHFVVVVGQSRSFLGWEEAAMLRDAEWPIAVKQASLAEAAQCQHGEEELYLPVDLAADHVVVATVLVIQLVRHWESVVEADLGTRPVYSSLSSMVLHRGPKG